MNRKYGTLRYGSPRSNLGGAYSSRIDENKSSLSKRYGLHWYENIDYGTWFSPELLSSGAVYPGIMQNGASAISSSYPLFAMSDFAPAPSYINGVAGWGYGYDSGLGSNRYLINNVDVYRGNFSGTMMNTNYYSPSFLANTPLGEFFMVVKLSTTGSAPLGANIKFTGANIIMAYDSQVTGLPCFGIVNTSEGLQMWYRSSNAPTFLISTTAVACPLSSAQLIHGYFSSSTDQVLRVGADNQGSITTFGPMLSGNLLSTIWGTGMHLNNDLNIPFSGIVCEPMFFKRDLTPQERITIRAYYGTKYNVSY